MKTYRVKAIATTWMYIDVVAKDEEDAFDKAEEADGADFVETDCSWEVLGSGIEVVD